MIPLLGDKKLDAIQTEDVQHLKSALGQDLDTTQRYMHLSPAALDAAIRVLEMGTESRGEILEVAGNRP